MFPPDVLDLTFLFPWQNPKVQAEALLRVHAYKMSTGPMPVSYQLEDR